MSTQTRLAIVTGGNRGIGFATRRQLAQQCQVILTSRDKAKGKAAAKQL